MAAQGLSVSRKGKIGGEEGDAESTLPERCASSSNVIRHLNNPFIFNSVISVIILYPMTSSDIICISQELFRDSRCNSS